MAESGEIHLKFVGEKTRIIQGRKPDDDRSSPFINIPTAVQRMYRWSSEVLRDYRAGSMIVQAYSVADARVKALGKFEAALALLQEVLAFYPDAETREELRAQWERDIAVEPEVLEGGVYLEVGADE